MTPAEGTLPPPQGPRLPGQSFDAWLLAGLLIQAENERDRIQEAVWRQRHQAAAEASPYLTAALQAGLRTRASLEERARRVALGTISFEWACCFICSECPEHHEELIEDLRREVALYRAAIDRQIRAIEWRVRPLCATRAPGEQIIAAAETVRGPLPRRRIIELCRHVAASTLKKRTAHA